MDVARVGSLFIRGPERTLLGRDMVFTLAMKEDVDAPRLFDAWASLVRDVEALRVGLAEEGDAFVWIALSRADVEARVERERASCVRPRPLDMLEGERSIRDDRLPFRYVLTGPREITIFFDHAIANGHSALHHIDALLTAYRCHCHPEAAKPPKDRPGDPWGPSRRQGTPTGQAAALRMTVGVLWALLYTVVFLLRAGRRAGRETVDLTRGRAPAVHALGYSVHTWTFSAEETARIADESRAAGRTVTESIACALGGALFALQPEKRRVLLSLPVHLGGDPATPGNPTGSLLLQLFRDGPLAPQVRAAFRGFRRGVPLGLARVVAATAKSERALRDRFAAQAKQPIAERAPFENFTCALSSLGVLRHPAIVSEVETIRAHGMTQTIFFGVMTLDGRLTIEASAAHDLFDARDVQRVGDALRCRLLALRAGEERAGFALVGEDSGIRARDVEEAVEL